MTQEISPQIANLFEKVKAKYFTHDSVSYKNKAMGHSLNIGIPGSGKTSSNRREAELRWELGHKIICLYDASRMDLAYFAFPSVSDFWKRPKYDGKKIIGARKYPVELLYPVTKRIPKKLPKNAKIFTIPVNEIDELDIGALTGSTSLETIKSVLNSMENKVHNNTTGHDYLNILGSMLKKTEDTDKIKISHFGTKALKGKVFTPLLNEGILSSKDSEYSLDIEAMLKDKKTISVLVLRHCPQKLWGFIVHYFMNHIFKLMSGIDGDKRIKMNATILLNEVSDLLQEGGDIGESSLAISRSIEKIAKQYRTANLYLLMDTQIPQTLPDIKDIIHTLNIFNSGFTEVNKALEIMGVSMRTGMITSDEINIIPFLPSGWYFKINKQSGLSFHKLLWTRSRSYLDGEDFYDIYDSVVGKMEYVDISQQLKQLKLEDEQSIQLWEKKEEIFKKQEEVEKENKNKFKAKPGRPKKKKEIEELDDDEEDDPEDTDDEEPEENEEVAENITDNNRVKDAVETPIIIDNKVTVTKKKVELKKPFSYEEAPKIFDSIVL